MAHLLGKWALNLMLINVLDAQVQATPDQVGRAVRSCRRATCPRRTERGMSKSAVSRRFVALSAERMKQFDRRPRLSNLDLLIIQIDGIHIGEDLMLLAAVGIDGNGEKHPLGVIEGATENTAVVQALLATWSGVAWSSAVCRLFINDGAGQGTVQGDPHHLRPVPYADPALPGPQGPQHHRAPCQARCQRPQSACAKRAELDDPDKAERLIKNFWRGAWNMRARRLRQHPREGLDEILTVTRLGLPVELRRSLACTSIIENMNGRHPSATSRFCRQRQTLAG